MKKNTLEEYKKAVKTKYDLVKEADVSGLLNNPSSGNIRELCVLASGEKMGSDDELIFRRFFDVKDDENIVKQVEKFDLDKLKPIGNYLKGKTRDTKPIIIELIAILVNFTPRPYNKFSKKNEGALEKEVTAVEEQEIIPIKGKEEFKNPERGPLVLLINEKAKANNNTSTFFTKQKKIIFLSIAGLFFTGYTAKDLVFPEKQCMQWQSDHFERVDCQCEVNALFASAPVIPFDEDVIELNKLKVYDTTPFFKAGKAVIWYCKVDGEPEFFDQPGFHPITGNALKAVTPYIINKYVKGK